MSIKVGINGFGRIGRMVLRSIIESDRKDLEIVAINNRGNSEISSFLLKHDTIHGKLKAKVDHSEKAIEEYWNLAKEFNLNPAQIAIKFCEIQPFVTSVIIGATTMEQLKTNIDSVNINLNKKIITKIGEIQKKYPNPCP